jgi:protein-disulfide isomerase
MKKRKDIVSNALTGILVVCALIITAAVIRRELIPKQTVSAALPQPRQIEGWQDLATAGHLIGSPGAPVKVVEFSDYQCPFCKTMHFTLEDLQKKFPGRITVVYRHFPLDKIHPHAIAAAAAAECAAAQGRFEAFTRLLFERQDSIGVASWEGLAHTAGVPDTTRFRTCRSETWVKERIEQDIAAANRIGVTGTPAIVIRDQMVSASLPLDTLEQWIRRAHPTGLER